MTKHIGLFVLLMFGCQTKTNNSEIKKGMDIEYMEFGVTGGSAEPEEPIISYILYPNKFFEIQHYFDGKKDTIPLSENKFNTAKILIDEFPRKLISNNKKTTDRKPANDSSSFYVHAFFKNNKSIKVNSESMGEETKPYEMIVWKVVSSLSQD